jgi:hypothetical protein
MTSILVETEEEEPFQAFVLYLAKLLDDKEGQVCIFSRGGCVVYTFHVHTLLHILRLSLTIGQSSELGIAVVPGVVRAHQLDTRCSSVCFSPMPC